MTYEDIHVYEDSHTSVDDLVKGSVLIRQHDKTTIEYLVIYMGFDIETTTTPEKFGYMYHWQLSINDDVILGRTWETFIHLIEWLKGMLDLMEDRRVICWIANCSFEFQFMRKRFHITEIFARQTRQPLKFVVDNCIEFRDCLQITGGGLAFLAKNYCKTQKMVGDLDYSIQRSYKTPLTMQEKQYCINDVVILSEFSEYIFKTYIIPDKFIPFTKTGLLRRQVKKGCDYLARLKVREAHPNYALYRVMMERVFRGGYVHANIFYVGYPVEGITGIDITSSYPTSMNIDYYPVTPFDWRPTEKIWDYIKTHCCIIHARFYGIRKKFAHTIESESKCVYVSPGKVIDNGRISSADMVDVWLTELDFKCYLMFYEWEQMEVLKLLVSNRGSLPQYLLNPMNKAYIKKNELKSRGQADTPEYAVQKSYVNSAYGLLVTRHAIMEIGYDDIKDEWIEDSETYDFESEVKRAFLLPQWGIWCTAHARHRLLKMVYKIEKRAYRLGIKKGCVLYCDTDSIKFVHPEWFTDLVDKYNADMKDSQLANCKKRDLPIEHFHDLGQFDIEYENVTGKFLGAKRYITKDSSGNVKVTVAGLPKKSLQKHCEKHGLDVFEVFNDGMLMQVDVAGKNAHAYNDEEHTEIIDGVEMTELSSVGIYPIEFTLKLQDAYILQILQLREENKRYEKRIY